MFGIEETPYDLKWRMFGIPVRVHPFFWIMAAIICWPYLKAFGIPAFALAIGAVFLSILVHEWGHVAAGLWFGSRGHIVLWGFGGLAIGSNDLHLRWQRIVVSAAGPAAQFVLYGLVWLLWESTISIEVLLKYPTYFFMLEWLLAINLYWPILNLLPIWPLDGGQITRDLIGYANPREAVRLSLHISIGVSALLASYALMADRLEFTIPYAPVGTRSAFFFALFAFISFQALQAEMAQRRSFDPWDHERS